MQQQNTKIVKQNYSQQTKPSAKIIFSSDKKYDNLSESVKRLIEKFKL